MPDQKTIKIFTMEQQFPCGPQSNCCGPIGQSEEEIASLKDAVEKLGVAVEICDIKKIETLQKHPQVLRLFRSFGPQAIPTITVGDEVACIGQSEIADVIFAIKSKL